MAGEAVWARTDHSVVAPCGVSESPAGDISRSSWVAVHRSADAAHICAGCTGTTQSSSCAKKENCRAQKCLQSSFPCEETQ